MMFTMKANEMQREIYVKINEDSQRQASQFKVVLLSESERSQLEGIDSSTTITITNNADAIVAATEFQKDAVVEIAAEEKDEKVLALRARLERVLNQPTELTYSQQFKQATMLASENAEEVSAYEGFVQYISMPWKLLFACIPPSSYMGGWLRFACAFVAIGLVSFLVLEITTTVGCMFDMRSAVQALVLVAIGTSLPDLTASRRAAESRRTNTADASIATLAGANAASVFIGLGLPWTIATIYHWANYGESFFVGKLPTADITFALVLFLACSVICFIVLALRRLIIGGELGGPGVSRVFSAIVMFFLWGAFITLNIMNSYGYLGARDIFVPSVAINANQHQASDWTAANRPVITKLGDSIKVEWTNPAVNNFCRVEFKSERLGVRVLDKNWMNSTLCPCDNTSVTRQSCTIKMTELNNDYNLNRCQKIEVRI
jgi:solute carrier family 8 (sodium/calcium exchanger)